MSWQTCSSSSVLTCEICGQETLSDDDMKTHVLLDHIDGMVGTSCFFCDLAGVTPDELTTHINAVHSFDENGTTVGFKRDRSPLRPLETKKRAYEVKQNADTRCQIDSTAVSAALSVNGCSSEMVEHDPWKMTVPMPNISSESRTVDSSCIPIPNPSNSIGSEFPCHSRSSLEDSSMTVGDSGIIVPSSAAMVTSSQKQQSVSMSYHTSNLQPEPTVSPSTDWLTKSDIFSCPLCSFVAVDSDTISRHVNTAHEDILSPATPAKRLGHDTTDDYGPRQCRPYPCPVCTVVARSESELNSHYAAEHIIDADETPVSENFTCPVCGEKYSDAGLLNIHADTHFRTNNDGASTASNSFTAQLEERRQSESERLKRLRLEEEKTENTENALPATRKGQSAANGSSAVNKPPNIPQTLVDDLRSCTFGLIERLRGIQTSAHSCHRRLCSSTDHFVSNGTNCGFRNLQMLLSCLLKNDDYVQSVFSGQPIMPSVFKLQQMIETAWEAGFDPAGCLQLNGKLVGTRKWIGTTEIVALLTYLHVRCELLDFHTPSGPNNTHPRLFNWVRDYFRQGEGRFLPPLYFQHQGHSRTIVGIEESSNGSLTLLVFDPGNNQMKQATDPRLLDCLRRPLTSVTKKQYQLVAIHGLLTPAEANGRKLIRSTRVP